MSATSYKCLNPHSIFIPVNTVALTPRLDNLAGKTIYIIQGEADPIIMPALNAALTAQYPGTTRVYYNPSSSFGDSAVPAAVKDAAPNGIIRGIGWWGVPQMQWHGMSLVQRRPSPL